MTLHQLNQRVQQEADARFGETIEHLLLLLEYQQRMKDVAVRCYCDELQYSKKERVCGYCREEDSQWRLIKRFTSNCF